MCATCEAMETMKATGELVCGSCGSVYAFVCSEGHRYCWCADPMDPYDGGAATRCFRCATGL